jgi:cadmium resistance protein CadD (predicted permease)
MGSLLIAVTLGLVTFVATSLDNLLLLISFLGNPSYPKRVVAPAYIGSILGVVALSALLSVVARFGPLKGRGLVFLGFVPIGLGLYYAVRLVLPGRISEQEKLQQSMARTMRMRKGRAAVIAVTLAASGDSLATYTALFADTRTWLMPATVGGILLGAVAWTWVAEWIMRQTGAHRFIEKVGPILLPIVLIALGLYILGDTPTDFTPAPI